MSIQARMDLFPAELIVDPDAPNPQDRRRVYPVRVVVTLDEVLVFKDASPRPELVFRDGLVSFSPAPQPHRMTKAERRDPVNSFSIATTDTGHALSFKRATGCGCGSRLKVLSLQALFDTQTQTQNSMISAASELDR